MGNANLAHEAMQMTNAELQRTAADIIGRLCTGEAPKRHLQRLRAVTEEAKRRNADQRHDNERLEQHTAASLRAERFSEAPGAAEIEAEYQAQVRAHNAELETKNRERYEGWHDLNTDQPGYEDGQPVYYTATPDNAGRLTTTSRPRDPAHCHNGHNKRLTRCQCDEQKWPEAK